MGIIVKYFGCLCIRFMVIIMCIDMYIYIVMGDHLCVFRCIHSSGQLFMLIFNKCVKLGYTELLW